MRLITGIAVALLGSAVTVDAAQVPPTPGVEQGNAGHHGNPMYAGMSDAGRAIMRAAMRSADGRTGREATGAARDRMLTALDAERLDMPALKRAMDDEREAANAAKVRQQTALIAAFQQLSLADRRAFVANAQLLRARVAEKTAGVRSYGGYGGAPGQPQ